MDLMEAFFIAHRFDLMSLHIGNESKFQMFLEELSRKQERKRRKFRSNRNKRNIRRTGCRKK